jgi:hypothetical protein
LRANLQVIKQPARKFDPGCTYPKRPNRMETLGLLSLWRLWRVFGAVDGTPRCRSPWSLLETSRGSRGGNQGNPRTAFVTDPCCSVKVTVDIHNQWAMEDSEATESSKKNGRNWKKVEHEIFWRWRSQHGASFMGTWEAYRVLRKMCSCSASLN